MSYMEILILTDAHAGQYNLNFWDIYNKTEENFNFKKVITLGDMIDLWRTNLDDCLIQNEDNINFLKKKCINIRGNHDYVLPEITKIKYYDEYNFKDFWFIHGHQIEANMSDLPFMSQDDYIKIAKRMCYCSKPIAKILEYLYGIYKTGSNSNIFRIQKVLQLAEVLYDNVVFGHYHKYRDNNNIKTLPALCDGYYTIWNTKENEFKIYKLH